MIRLVKRKNLDVERYNTCIVNSVQSRIYGYSWYLDIVAENWDVLILNDFEAVMPLPWKRKYFLKYITQPLFCQQLGVFSKNETDDNSLSNFIKAIPKSFLKVNLNGNFNLSFGNSTERKNYILSLNNDYDSLFKGYSKTRKQRVKKAQKANLLITDVLITELIDLYEENYSYSGFSSAKLESIAVLNEAKLIGIKKEDELIGGAVFLVIKNRIIYLFSAFNENGKKYQAASFLIDHMIQTNQKTNTILDFEGGNLKNIEAFFKSFGSKIEPFYSMNFWNIFK